MLVMAFIQGIVIKIYQLEKSCTLTQGCQSMCNGLIIKPLHILLNQVSCAQLLCTGHLIQILMLFYI